MRLIAHRGNTSGKTKFENHPEQITAAIDKGFDVEIDLRYDERNFYLGHDYPDYKITIQTIEEWSKRAKIYVHCKDIKSAVACPRTDKIIPFCHTEDEYVLLTNGIVWVHPKVIYKIPPAIRYLCIPVFTEEFQTSWRDYHSICTDFPEATII